MIIKVDCKLLSLSKREIGIAQFIVFVISFEMRSDTNIVGLVEKRKWQCVNRESPCKMRMYRCTLLMTNKFRICLSVWIDEFKKRLSENIVKLQIVFA